LIEGERPLGLTCQDPGALMGHLIKAKRFGVFLGGQKMINQAWQPLLGNQNGEGNALLISMYWATEDPTNNLVNHAVVAVATIKIIAKLA
jgi:hypothetical protein